MLQKGFSAILLIITVLVVIAIGFLFWQFSSKVEKPPLPFTSNQNGNQHASQDSDKPPLKLKSIGVNFDDFKFTKQKLQFNRIFMGFGFVIPGNMSSTNQDKSNPQPTYILPMGTPVRSLVDGIVASMPTVWSGDYSIQVTESGQMEKWVYETEHVIKPKVKVGDKVRAGQIIAEVSDFDTGAPAGFGAVEIGILKGGQKPEHVCPFAYLDDSIKEETFQRLNTLFKSWEDYIGDQTLYDENTSYPGCLTLEPIEG
ncbi:MAG: M23 family metallopeptidase [Patescibacteria group bacterium]